MSRVFGLLGKSLVHSFSKNFFTEKFQKESISDAVYQNFELPSIADFKELVKANTELCGLNVTIPYKEDIIPYLDRLDKEAVQIGAVNTIKIDGEELLGYNTDVFGFHRSLAAVLKSHHERALILGTGGASKAVAHVFQKLGVDFKFVSRNPAKDQFSYEDLNEYVLKYFTVIVNTTPLGTFPKVVDYPNIPYQLLTDKHLLYDLVYNPAETSFLKRGKEKGAAILNGHRMLVLQAEKSWEIWNS